METTELAVEVIDPSWLYQTTIDTIRVTVRRMQDNSYTGYSIQVERRGKVVNSFHHDDQTKALHCADILRDIYYNELDMELLAH